MVGSRVVLLKSHKTCEKTEIVSPFFLNSLIQHFSSDCDVP
jgi:hypothetical protein